MVHKDREHCQLCFYLSHSLWIYNHPFQKPCQLFILFCYSFAYFRMLYNMENNIDHKQSSTNTSTHGARPVLVSCIHGNRWCLRAGRLHKCCESVCRICTEFCSTSAAWCSTCLQRSRFSACVFGAHSLCNNHAFGAFCLHVQQSLRLRLFALY